MKRTLLILIGIGLVFDRQRRVERRIKAQQQTRDDELRKWGEATNASLQRWSAEAAKQFSRLVAETQGALMRAGRERV